VPRQDKGRKVVVCGVEPRQRTVEYLPQPFKHLQVRHVPPLLVLVDARRGHRHVQARYQAQLPLRKTDGFPCFAYAQRHDTQRNVRWHAL